MQKSLVSQFWGSAYTGYALAIGFGAIAIVLLCTKQNSGVSIAVMAVAAALMSVRNLNDFERIAWMAIISFLLISEFAAIRRDHEDDREKFSRIASDLQTTATQLKIEIQKTDEALEVASQAVAQTRPRPRIDFTTLLANVSSPRFVYTISYQNNGNDVARNVHVFSETFLGKPGDVTLQNHLIDIFRRDWARNQGNKDRNFAMGDLSPWTPHNVSRYSGPDPIPDDMTADSMSLKTIYVLVRFSYEDQQGKVNSDFCLYIHQDPVKLGNSTVSSPCNVPFYGRYVNE